MPITLALIERLLTAYPGIVAGVKDSSGDWNNTKAMLDTFEDRASTSSPAARSSSCEHARTAASAASPRRATSIPARSTTSTGRWQSADADHQQAEISATRAVLQRIPMIPALKATIAHFLRDPGWRTVRPPLVELTPAQETELVAGLAARGFDMPGLRD